MFDKIVYRICDKIVSVCELIKDRIRATPQKDWIKDYRKWKSRINNNDTENTGNTNTTNTKQ
jgi:hypothetical protein